MTPGATGRLMAAYLTWRGIPPPRSLESLIQRTLQPHVPPPQPGTYGNAVVARMLARGIRLDGSSYSPRRTTATITTPRSDPAPRQQLGPRTYGPEHGPRCPPHPRTHPPPPPPHPPPNHTNNTPPTPRGLQAIRHHLGRAHHRAPDKSVRPNGRRNDNQHNTTRPQGAGTPSITCQERSPTRPHEYGGGGYPARAAPRHRPSAQGTGPEPHREPATPNTTRRACARPTAGSQPSGNNTGPPGTPPAPWHT